MRKRPFVVSSLGFLEAKPNSGSVIYRAEFLAVE